MKKIFNGAIFVILMSYFSKGLCQENEETNIGVEYMQIFRNIPSLFEYFLDVLEKRVEILEKDDLAAYQVKNDEIDASECDGKNEMKRETEPCLETVNDSLYDEENSDNNYYDKTFYGVNKYKRQNSYESLDYAYTTEVYEYGRANAKIPNNAQEIVEQYEGPIKNNIKRDNDKSKLIHNRFNKPNTNIHKEKSVKNKDKLKRELDRRNMIQLGDNFGGTDWFQSFLSPEEVEEKAIRTEQIIEEHNLKNRNK